MTTKPPTEPSERRMRAYWYGFNDTGQDCIDDILEAVAIAGKRFHNTEEWGGSGWESDEGGETCEQAIQKAADRSAKQVADLEARLAAAEQRYETSHACRVHAERALETAEQLAERRVDQWRYDLRVVQLGAAEGELDAALGRLKEIKELHVHDGYCGTCVHDFACPTYRLATDEGEGDG